MNAMLSEALSEIGGLLKQLLDCLTGQDEAKRQQWLTEFKKFLRKEPCWVTNTVQAIVGAIVSYVVDCTVSLEDMIKAGKYDWVNSDITAKWFPVKSTGADEWEFKMFHFDRSITSENAVVGIKADDVTNPWQPASIEHLLTYGKHTPEEQRKDPIVARGSVGEVDGDRRVPYLDEDTRSVASTSAAGTVIGLPTVVSWLFAKSLNPRSLDPLGLSLGNLDTWFEIQILYLHSNVLCRIFSLYIL